MSYELQNCFTISEAQLILITIFANDRDELCTVKPQVFRLKVFEDLTVYKMTAKGHKKFAKYNSYNYLTH